MEYVTTRTASEACVLPSEVQLWKLSAPGGDGCLGLCCNEDGLFLGRTALVERRGQDYAVRPQAELERLLMRAYGAEIALDRAMPGFRVVAAAVGERNLCLAQIAAVQLRMPDLFDEIARGSLEAEDRLVKAGRGGDRLARAGWDPTEHPRAGVPPNPGWFAPTDGRQAPTRIAQGEEDERAPEELLDPQAPVRQALWDARIATLRQIDPGNPNLTYFSNPGTAPSQEALDRLSTAVEAAAIKRVTDKVMPNGVPIGKAGTGFDVRELPGGLKAATDLFDYLRVGGTPGRSGPNLTVVKLAGDAGFITFRPVSSSESPAIDINLPATFFMRIHFP